MPDSSDPTLGEWLQGTVHADKVFADARRLFVGNVTGASFDECLHRATIDAAADSVRRYLRTDGVVERVMRAIDESVTIVGPRCLTIAANAALSAALATPKEDTPDA